MECDNRNNKEDEDNGDDDEMRKGNNDPPSPSPRLCPSTAGCSPPSMPSIVVCLLLSCFTFHLGFVHPLQDVALHQCLPLSSVCRFPVSPFTWALFIHCRM